MIFIGINKNNKNNNNDTCFEYRENNDGAGRGLRRESFFSFERNNSFSIKITPFIHRPNVPITNRKQVHAHTHTRRRRQAGNGADRLSTNINRRFGINRYIIFKCLLVWPSAARINLSKANGCERNAVLDRLSLNAFIIGLITSYLPNKMSQLEAELVLARFSCTMSVDVLLNLTRKKRNKCVDS